MEMEALRKAIAPRLAADAYQSLLRALADERKVEISSSTARLPGHNATSNPEDERLWQLVLPVLQAGGASPPTVIELAAALKLKEATLKDFLHRKSRSGDPLRVPPDRFYLRATLAALAATAAEVARASPNGMFTAAQYRDATGTGRGLAIQILEVLDGLGVTQRLGDARKMRKDPAAVLGAAAPFKPAAKPPAAGATNPAAQKREPQIESTDRIGECTRSRKRTHGTELRSDRYRRRHRGAHLRESRREGGTQGGDLRGHSLRRSGHQHQRAGGLSGRPPDFRRGVRVRADGERTAG
jgi:hypothetical protein